MTWRPNSRPLGRLGDPPMIEERAHVELRTETAAAVLAELGVPSVHDDLRIDCMRSGNEVFRVTIGADAFFVKVPAKDLEAWPDPLEGVAVKVNRERSAHEFLRARAIPAVDVVGYSLARDNALRRPYLVTRRGPGQSFTAVVRETGEEPCHAPLAAVGEYLAAVHAVELDGCGFLESPAGDVAASRVDPPRGSHDPEVEQLEALRDLDKARPFIRADLYAELERRFERYSNSDCRRVRPTAVRARCIPPEPSVRRSCWRALACLGMHRPGSCVRRQPIRRSHDLRRWDDDPPSGSRRMVGATLRRVRVMALT